MWCCRRPFLRTSRVVGTSLLVLSPNKTRPIIKRTMSRVSPALWHACRGTTNNTYDDDGDNYFVIVRGFFFFCEIIGTRWRKPEQKRGPHVPYTLSSFIDTPRCSPLLSITLYYNRVGYLLIMRFLGRNNREKCERARVSDWK